VNISFPDSKKILTEAYVQTDEEKKTSKLIDFKLTTYVIIKRHSGKTNL